MAVFDQNKNTPLQENSPFHRSEIHELIKTIYLFVSHTLIYRSDWFLLNLFSMYIRPYAKTLIRAKKGFKQIIASYEEPVGFR